ncbi:MAG TPA: isocitrate lyase/PEP mutase family protein [Bacillota bacterium]
MKRSQVLRRLLAGDQALLVPGAYNAMTAKIVEQVGFPVVYMTGYGTSLGLLGMPDAGLATMTEMILNARYMANAVSIPLIADADTGYGNAINVMRTVREFIQAGVAAIHIEDQVAPKRCGHVAGKQVIPIEEAVGRYRAAARVRDELDPDFVLIARTDARGAVNGGFDEALRRAQAYLEAGADLAFVEGLVSEEEVERAARATGALLYNSTGVSPRIPLEQLSRWGVKIVLIPGLITRATAMAAWDVAADLRERGIAAEVDFQQRLSNHALADWHGFAGFHEIRRLEEAYLPAEETAKYEGTIGYQP